MKILFNNKAQRDDRQFVERERKKLIGNVRRYTVILNFEEKKTTNDFFVFY